jgi:MerR family transcriptional regulator, light-induced transcriptional regulator
MQNERFMQNLNKNATARHRIGAVSKLSGVPIPTLRVWESRYSAFTPLKTDGAHRLYGEDDLLKATLLRQLSEHGHAISSIANLDNQSLNELLQKYRHTSIAQSRVELQGDTVNLAIVGNSLAARIESKKFTLKYRSNAIRVTQIYDNLETALEAGTGPEPHILLTKVMSLDANTCADIFKVVNCQKVLQSIVIYSYGQEKVIEAMKQSGMIVRRDPISDYDLADLISSVLLVDAAKSIPNLSHSAMIPARKYSDATLLRIAGISTDVLCECPRHVAEIISQLANFELYSQECLNKTPKDAHLHAYLSSVSGSARALFERALEMVATYENISLEEQ